jgi:tetraacyldisaccharide 4'-kinase
MFDRQQLLKIITGQRNDLAARLVRGAMSALTPVYRSVVAIRNRRFDQDQGQRILKAEIPVISVGNLTTGGTGKTPMVIFVAQFLRSLGKRVVIVSRGYQGSQHANTGRNDEALEMEIRLPDVPHMQDPDRIRMIQVATEELMSEVAVLDDGFQHRQAHRDLDIVLIDATEPFGFGRLLPRGLLREPIESLARADVVVITRCQLADQTSISNIEKRIRAVHSDVLIVKAETVTRRWLQYDGSETAIDGLKAPVFAFCGIGNPAGFAGTLDQLGVEVVGDRVFEDHHVYSREDLESLAAAAREAGAKALVCTHKDLVKIGVNRFQDLPVYALLIDLQIVSGDQQLKDRIESVVASAQAGGR